MPFKLWFESHLFHHSKEKAERFVSIKNLKQKTQNQLLTILSTFHSLAHSSVSYLTSIED